MELLRADAERPDGGVLSRARAVLERGELLIYPTDTLYALGGRALDAGAARRVRDAKGREAGKPLPLVLADREQIASVCAAFPPAADRLAAEFWPGPLTLVVPARRELPGELTSGSGSVAVRVPASTLARALCAEAGPLISTSANLSGGAAPLTCAVAVEAVGFAAALALDAGPGHPQGSTIVDLTAVPPRLLRRGPIAWEAVEAVLLSAPAC